jgi:hypothetical protein
MVLATNFKGKGNFAKTNGDKWKNDSSIFLSVIIMERWAIRRVFLGNNYMRKITKGRGSRPTL